MRRKILYFISLITFPLAILFGVASWLIYSETIFSPTYDSSNVLAAYFEDDQHGVYTGSGQLPSYDTEVENPDDSILSYAYADKNIFNLYVDANFIDGAPIDVGVYWIRITPFGTGNQPLYVTYTIDKATPIVDTEVSVIYNQGPRSNYFTTEQNTSTIQYNGTFKNGSVTVPGTIKFSDTTNSSLKIGTYDYEWTFTPTSTKNYEVVKGTCSITTYATVSFYDGSILVSTKEVPYGNKITAVSYTPPTGYSFEGWYYLGHIFDFNSPITENMRLDTLNSLITYTITYNLDGGTLNSVNPSTYTIETPSFKLNNPTKSGSTFAGWTGSNGSEKSTSVTVSKGTTGNLVFNANWKYVAVFYDTDKTTILKTVDIIDGEVISPTYYALTDYQYKRTFNGWSKVDTDEIISTSSVTTTITGLSSSINLYAKVNEEIRSYTVNVYYKDKDNQASSTKSNSTDLTNSGGWTGGKTAAYYTTQVFDFVNKVGVSTASYTFGNPINLKRQIRIGETYYCYSNETTTEARYLFMMYMSPIDSFNWNDLLDSSFINSSGVGGNDNYLVSISGDTLNIVVLCVQPAAVVSTRTIASTTNTNFSETEGKFYKTVDEAFNACKNVSSKTYLRVYGTVYYTNSFTTNATDNVGSKNVIGSNTTINAYSKEIGGITYSFPKYTINIINQTLTQDFSIGSNVSVILSYGRHDNGADGYLTKQTEGCTYGGSSVQSLLIIKEGVKLTVNGSLTVGAYLMGASSPTLRGVIMNNGTIELNSKLVSYGFIKGSGKLIVNSSASVTDLFTIYDWPGGANATGMNSKKIFPFQCYSFHCISCETIIYKGASYKAWAQLYMASSWATAQEITIVGSGGLFELSNGYLIKSVEDTTKETSFNSSYTSSNLNITQRDKVKIYGDFKDNSISVTAKVFVSTTITTSTDLAMPLGFSSIEICSGTGTLAANSYKFLPGSKFIVDKGAKLIISNNVKVVFYDSYDELYEYNNGSTTQIGYNNPYSYVRLHNEFYKAHGALDSSNAPTYTHTEGFGATLIVNGSLDVIGHLGGIILTTEDSGAINLGNNSASLPRLSSLSYGRTGSSATTTTDTIYAQFYEYNKDTGLISSSLSNANTGIYYSVNVDNKYGFIGQNNAYEFVLIFETNGANEIVESISKKALTSTINISEEDLPYISKNGYEFGGWYLDSGFTNPAIGSTISEGTQTTLYAKWIEKTYTINYHYLYDEGCSTSGNITNSNPTSFTINSSINLVSPIDGSLTFGGWCIDSECSVAFSKINSTTLKNYINYIDSNGGVLDLYGRFSDKEYYNITYFDEKNNIDINSIYTIISGTQITLKDPMDSYSNTEGLDTTWFVRNEYTFVEWIIYSTDLIELARVSGSGTYTPTCNIYIKPRFEKITYVKVTISQENATITLTDSNGNNISDGAVVPSGTIVKIEYKFTGNSNRTFKLTDMNGTKTYNNDSLSGTSHTLISNTKFEASSSCLAAGTLILMADGTQLPIEEVKKGDYIKTYNFFTGSFENQKVIIKFTHEESVYLVKNLIFSDGTILRTVGEHGVFNYTLNKYTYIDENNYKDYIGHQFVKYVDDGYVLITLQDVEITYEKMVVYSITSQNNYNVIAESMLTIAPPDKFYNWIEMSGKMQYDVDKFNKEIEMYGLYTYDDFKDYVTYEQFIDWGGPYLKIAVEKGYFDFDYIITMIKAYLYLYDM